MYRLIAILSLLIIMLVSCGEQHKPQEPADKSASSGNSALDKSAGSQESVVDGATTDEQSEMDTTAPEFEPGGERGKPLVGKVVSLDAITEGRNTSPTPVEARKLVSNGRLLLFQTDKYLYFVYNADGSFAGPNLAKYSGKKVGLVGKPYYINGIMIFVADLIKPI